jgi:hypothetical protein
MNGKDVKRQPHRQMALTNIKCFIVGCLLFFLRHATVYIFLIS